MKKILIAQRSLLLAWPVNPLSILLWGEQVAAYFVSMNVDWRQLPFAVGGAIIGMLKARKDEKGEVIHKTFTQWTIYALAGTFVAMVFWKDLQNVINSLQKIATISDGACTFIAGLIAWKLVDYIERLTKKKTDESTTL